MRKPRTFLDLVGLLERDGVNTEDDLRNWLQRDDSAGKLLDSMRFVGQKTVDYFSDSGLACQRAAMDPATFLSSSNSPGSGKVNYERGQG